MGVNMTKSWRLLMIIWPTNPLGWGYLCTVFQSCSKRSLLITLNFHCYYLKLKILRIDRKEAYGCMLSGFPINNCLLPRLQKKSAKNFIVFVTFYLIIFEISIADICYFSMIFHYMQCIDMLIHNSKVCNCSW